MLKVKMLTRHTGPTGKMEQGLCYLLPRSYAEELVNHGLAFILTEPIQPLPDSEITAASYQPPVNVNLGPTKTMAMETALREMRDKNQMVISKPKKRK